MPSQTLEINWEKYNIALDRCQPMRLAGRVTKVVGLTAEGQGLGLDVGSQCAIQTIGDTVIPAEVVGFREDKALLMPYGSTRGIRPGSRITLTRTSPRAAVGEAFIGRVVDGLGRPLDGQGDIAADTEYPLYGQPINPLERSPIKEIMDVGIGAVNTMITIGMGQRIAIMSGSGVGKSILMGMMAKYTAADVVVMGLIGERGREVLDFVKSNLGKKGMKKAVVVGATSDSPPLVKMRGAYLATTLAEYFRDRGRNVLLIMDSITRFAMASREVGLSAGEPPTTKGYTPSFFSQIPVLLERAGNVSGKGSITGIYTVLVEADDMNDPVGDTIRSIVDGHIVLSRNLANRNHYPAISVLESVSRVMRDVVTEAHVQLRGQAVDIMATYADAEDMISIGAYGKGTDPRIDRAIDLMPKINGLLRQDISEKKPYAESLKALEAVFK